MNKDEKDSMNESKSENTTIVLLTVCIILGVISIIMFFGLISQSKEIKEHRLKQQTYNNQGVIIDRLKAKINELESADLKDNENYVTAKKFYEMESSYAKTIAKYETECRVMDRSMKAAVKILNGK